MRKRITLEGWGSSALTGKGAKHASAARIALFAVAGCATLVLALLAAEYLRFAG